VPRHRQADGKKQHLNELFENGIQRIVENALEGGPAFFHCGDNSAKPSLGQYHASRGFSDIGCCRHSDAYLRLAQRRCVIGAIAAHSDRMPVLLECFDQIEFSFRKDACEYREVFGFNAVW